MRDIGSLLKSKREEKNISIEEVAVATKISVKILQALEEGDLSKLPAKPFVRGFIQSYAKYLGLDVSEVLQLFQQSVGTTKPETAIVMPKTDNPEKNLPGSGRQLLYGVAIVIVIALIVWIQRAISKKEAEMKSTVQAVNGSEIPVTISPTPSPSASPDLLALAPLATDADGGSNTLPLSTPMPSPETKAASKAIAKATPKAKPTPRPSPEIKASANEHLLATNTMSPTPAATAITEASATPVETPSPTPEADTPQEVIVEALDHVMVRVTIDNKAAKEIQMNAEQILTFKAKHHLKLYTPNGGAISVIQNGYEIGVPGNLGQPKTMNFPQ